MTSVQPQSIVPSQPPDQAAYDRCVAAIGERRGRLAVLLAERDALRGDLARFEALLHNRVGDLMNELRRLQRTIRNHERRLARIDDLDPDELDDPDLESDDEATYAAAPPHRNGRDPDADDDAMAENNGHRPGRRTDREIEAEAKRLYRELAKRCHPDFAQDDTDRERRVALMQRVNETYRARDLSALRLLRREADAADPSFALRPIAERLAWVREDLVRLEAEIADLSAELATLRSGDVYRLWRRHQAGEPAIDDLEVDLERRLTAEGRRLDNLVVAYRTALDDRRAGLIAP